MRGRWIVLVLLFGLVAGATPAAATVVEIAGTSRLENPLSPEDLQKLLTLQSTAFPALLSPVSPDDSTILTAVTSPVQTAVLQFVNVNDGSARALDRSVREYAPITEMAWRDANTLMWVSSTFGTGTVIIAVDRDSGSYTRTSLRLPGFPISLAPNGTRLLLARSVTIEEMSASASQESPFRVPVKPMPEEPAGTTKFDAQDDVLTLAIDAVELSVYDINSQAITTLGIVPESTGLMSAPSWSADGTKLALVRTTIPDLERGANSLATVATQDGLGALPPAENPFLQGNVVDVFDLASGVLRLDALKAADGDGHLYARAQWSTDGQTLMTQVQRPAQLTGRQYPIYQYPDRSALRFYDANLTPIGGLDRPEIEAPTTVVPQWVSPDEIIINAPYGPSYRIFYFNRVSGEFRQVSAWDGTTYQVRSTNHSRQLVYNFGAYQHPDELYRIGWDGTGLAALTTLNAEAAALNQVRVDSVSFTLANGAQRSGYLVQPAGAAFPPVNAPIVMWQQGGPGLTMTNEWFATVESPFSLLPNFGIGLLVVSLPGREGFGPVFYNGLADGTNYGQIDIDEGAEIVRQMIAQGWTSSERVGVTGCSYGGYFTTQIITQHPDLFAAANPQCSLLDLLTEWQTGFTPFLGYLEGSSPTSNPQEFVRDSPVYNATRVQTPLLMFHGSSDFLPVSTAANFHDQVEANGTPADLLVFLGERHGLARVTSQSTAGQAQVQWFREHLGVTPAP